MNLDKLKITKGQNIIFLNVRSLYAHITESQTEFSGSSFMCSCFCETWLTAATDEQLLSIDGYKIVRLDRNTEKKGGGLVIYTRNDLSCEIVKYSFQ